MENSQLFPVHLFEHLKIFKLEIQLIQLHESQKVVDQVCNLAVCCRAVARFIACSSFIAAAGRRRA